MPIGVRRFGSFGYGGFSLGDRVAPGDRPQAGGGCRPGARAPSTLITCRVYAIFSRILIRGVSDGLEAEFVGHACAGLRHGTRQLGTAQGQLRVVACDGWAVSVGRLLISKYL